MAESRQSLPSDAEGSLGDPRLMPFLPMVYVAWADGNLTPQEIDGICERIDAHEELHSDCRSALGRWLDPDQPPSARELAALLGVIRRAGRSLPLDRKRSLSELGVELAAVGDAGTEPAVREALEDIERALGVAGVEVSRALLVPDRPKPAQQIAEPVFDVTAMSCFLDGDQRALKQSLRHLLSQPRFAYRPGLKRSKYRAQVLAWCRDLAAQGLGGLAFPEEYGGQDDMPAFIAAFETLAFHDLSLTVKFGVQFGLFAGSIYQLGTEEHHRRYLPAAASLELPGCFAMTETGHGSNVQDLETLARYEPDSDQFEIHTPDADARKDYIGNAAEDGRMAVVFAQLTIDEERHGVHAFLVPIRDQDGAPAPGVTIEDCGQKMGLNGVDNGRISFDRVRVPRTALLDRFAEVDEEGVYSSPISSSSKRFFTMLGTLVGGRVSVAKAAASASKSALTIAVRYAERRRQFGPAGEPELRLLDYLTHQRRLLPRLATTYGLDFALAHLVAEFAGSSAFDRRKVEGLAAGLKAFATWHATETIQVCREACGGQGYLAENRFSDLKADSDVFTTFEGDNTVLLQLVAKGLLLDYRHQFGDMSLTSLARYAADAAATVLSELNPVITRNTDPEHLRGLDFQLGALAWRERHLLATVARRLKARVDRGMATQEALIECQDHLLELAKAHTERVVLEQFDAAIARAEDETLGGVLTIQRQLFGLARIERQRGWFLEHHYLEPGKAKAIRKEVNRLCRESRPLALPLVDAFGIPDALLAAPIALP